MFISENGLNLIKEFEGCILQSYDDYNDRIVSSWSEVRGTLTIGWGHTNESEIYPGMRISQQQADDMLRNDMVKYCNQVDEVINEGTISFPVNQNMYDALVSFDYNCGQGSLRSLCRNRDKQTVADMLLEYRNKGSQWEAGLLRRRQAERSLFLSDSECVDVVQSSPQPVSQGNEEIRRLQHELNAQGFRDCNGNQLDEDGRFGDLTLSALPLVKRGANGNITGWIQLRVGVECDNDFGQDTENGVKYFQQSRGLDVDGVVFTATWRELCKSV